MTTVSETTLVASLPIGVPTSFGTIVPSFEQLIGYVDSSAAPVGSRIQWKLYAISGGVRSLAAVSDPIPSSANPYTIFVQPGAGAGRGVGMIAGTTYEIVGIAQDGTLPNIKAGFVGYDIEANTQPNEVASAAHPLVFGSEVVFGSLTAHHVRVQVQFDAETPPVVTGSADITAGGLYGGGGSLNGTTLNMTVNNVTAAIVFSGAGAGNSSSEAAMLAAINAAWPGLNATQGGPGGNKLVLTDLITSGVIIVAAGSANAFLGLTPGTTAGALVANASGEARIYGTITGTAGSITALIARGPIVSPEADPSIPIDLTGLGFVSAQLKIFCSQTNVGAGSVTAVIIGADLNLDIGGGGVVLLANSSYASGIIYRPGGAPWSQAAPTVFPVWGGPFPSVMAALALTSGDVNIEIDDSITSPAPIPAAGMPVGGWDMQSRVTFTSANPNQTGLGAQVSIPDGSTLKNLQGVNHVALNSFALSAGSNLPSLSYTHSMVVTLTNWGSFAPDGTATRPMVDVAAAIFLHVDMFDRAIISTFAVTGAEVFNLLSAGTNLQFWVFAGAIFDFPKGIVTGGGHLFVARERAGGTFVTTAAYTGPAVVTQLMEGPDVANQAIVTGATTFVVDNSFLTGVTLNPDETIVCRPAGAGTTIIDLPDATLFMNKGRYLKIVDGNGTSGANTISLVPFGAQNLNGANALKALSSNWGIWTVYCDGTQWIVAQSAGI